MTREEAPKYRMAHDYSDGTVRKFVWDNGWKEVEQEPCNVAQMSLDDAIKHKELKEYKEQEPCEDGE